MKTPSPMFWEASVETHTPQGKRFIQVMVESWLSYYNITAIQANELMLEDIVIMMDTFGSFLMGGKKQSKSNSVDAMTLANVIGDLVLSYGLKRGDKAAVQSMKQLCLTVMSSEVFEGLDNIDMNLVIEQAVQRIRETLADDTYDFVELPPPMKDLAEVCMYEAISEWCKSHSKSTPPNVDREIQDKQDMLTALIKSLSQERIREDKIWNLLNAPMYCDCIKRSFLALGSRQQVLLAFCYYHNQRVSSSEAIEALGDIGTRNTRRNTRIDHGNIDRNLHYILNEALPRRLAQEFATSLGRIITHRKEKGSDDDINPCVLPYLNRSSSPMCVDSDKLLELCKRDIGIRRGTLMSKEILMLCRVLSPKQLE